MAENYNFFQVRSLIRAQSGSNFKNRGEAELRTICVTKGRNYDYVQKFLKVPVKKWDSISGTKKLGAQLQNPSKFEQQGFGMIERIQTS